MTEEEDIIRNREVEDPFAKEKEEEHNFWNGLGHVEFYVHANRPDVFEIEILDYSGCVGGMGEGSGIEYYLEDCWEAPLIVKEGRTYSFENITVNWILGDGRDTDWATDDDVEYDYGYYVTRFNLVPFLKTKLTNLWWFSLGYRIRNFLANRKLKKGAK